MMTPDERLVMSLRSALPKQDSPQEPSRDLWPALLARTRERPSAPWFDWALAGGVLLLLALFPATLPVLLYCL